MTDRPTCGEALGLVPRYLDGELAEERASGLRGHLLACRDCRAVLQGERDLRRWFEPGQPVAVPSGFAARVAALASLGLATEARPRDAAEDSAPVGSRSGGGGSDGGALLAFTVRLVALAALALLALSLALALAARPDTPTRLLADPLPEVLERLDQLNRQAPAPWDGEREAPGARPR